MLALCWHDVELRADALNAIFRGSLDARRADNHFMLSTVWGVYNCIEII